MKFTFAFIIFFAFFIISCDTKTISELDFAKTMIESDEAVSQGDYVTAQNLWEEYDERDSARSLGTSIEEYRKFSKNLQFRTEITNKAEKYRNTSICSVLPEKDDRLLCVSAVYIRLEEPKLCLSLGKRNYVDHCLEEIGKKTKNIDICQQIKEDSRKKNCEFHIKRYNSQQKGFDFPSDYGNNTEVPEFILALNNFENDKIIWWAKNFKLDRIEIDILTNYVYYSWNYSDGTRFGIGTNMFSICMDNDENISVLNNCCKNNAACDSKHAWAYEYKGYTGSNYIHVYCPSFQAKCQKLFEYFREMGKNGSE